MPKEPQESQLHLLAPPAQSSSLLNTHILCFFKSWKILIEKKKNPCVFWLDIFGFPLISTLIFPQVCSSPGHSILSVCACQKEPEFYE